MSKCKFPKAVRALLSENKIEEQDILAASGTDMNTECEYADGFVVLTSKKLAVVTSAPDKNEVHSFKGYQSRIKEELEEIDRPWACRIYELDRLDKLHAEALVACSVLVADVDGTALRLTVFSNLYKRDIHNVVRTVDRLKNPSPMGVEEAGKGPERDKKDDEYCPVCGMMYPDKTRKVCPRCMDRKSIFRRVLGYFKPYIGKIIVMLLACFATAGLNLVWPYLNGKILYDQVLEKNNEFLARFGIEDGRFVTGLLLVVLTMLMARITIAILYVIHSIFTARIVTCVVRDMKKSIFEQMGKLSISFFRSKQTGSLMTRVMSDAERITGFFIDGVPNTIINSLTLIVSLVMMFSLNWQMASFVIFVIPAVMYIGLKLRPKIWTMFGRRHRAERSVNSQVNDNLTGARVVKAFGQESRETERFDKNNNRLRTAEMGIVVTQNKVRGAYSVIYEVLNICVYIVGVYMILVKHEIELGTLITFTGYVGQLQGPINFFSRIFHWWADSMNSAQRMFEIIDSIPEIQEAENPVSMPSPKGKIELQNVSFGYEVNRPVLKELNLEIKEGSMLGIVGRSGAGKTTLVNLISRMYDPQEGKILIDGVDVKDIAFKDLRRNVAMVSQETYIFMGTVEENIAYANPDASHEDVIRAAKLASAHEFIMRMPDGYNTRIGSSGRELSGGEKQRISIARAILSNPRILILDEATASVDTETERAIQRSISYLVKGRTTISIAHRLSTLKDADYLVVIDNGRITERGTHKELEEQRGTYFKLMELQRKALALKE
ncbi:MAG: ABC transporter ATP-binding protein/permease [Lachnospiraceae bacterium]|nr:ABC transporter ATP-binding protein/permease [Lachnospiraceae bacterium]